MSTDDDATIDAETRRKLQITALVEMFVGLGAEAAEDRVAYYARVLAHIPPFLLRAACDAAVLASGSSWPPGPGEIAQHARRIASERRAAARERERRALFAAARADVAARLEAGNEPDLVPANLEATVTDLTARLGMPTAPRTPRRELAEQARRIRQGEDLR